MKKHFVVGHSHATWIWGLHKLLWTWIARQIFLSHTLEEHIHFPNVCWPIVQSKLAYKFEFRFPWCEACLAWPHITRLISSSFTATLVTLSKLEQQVVSTYLMCFGCKGFCFQLVGPRLHNTHVGHWVKNNEPVQNPNPKFVMSPPSIWDFHSIDRPN